MSDRTPPTEPDVRRSALAAALCVVVSGLARWWVHRDLYAADPTLLSPALDDLYYMETIGRIARGEPFDSFLAHLHPWLAVMAGAGPEPGVAFLGGLNAVLGALTSGGVALAAGLFAGRRAAWTAGLLHALAGVFVFHDVLPGQEAAIGLATAVAVLCGVALVRGGAPRAAPLVAAALGAAVGMAAIGRGTSLLLGACALPALRGRTDRTRLALLAAAGLGVVLAAGSVWNHRVGGPLSPFPWSGGANLYLTNGPDARETVSMTAGRLGYDPWSIERNAAGVPARALGRPVSRRESSSWWTRQTFEESGGAAAITAHLARKALLFWTSEERGSNHSAHAEREYATLLRVVPVSGWWLLALGAGAWWLVRRQRPAADVAAAGVVATWAGLTVFFPVERYRLPALVGCAVLVGAAAAARADRRRWMAAGALAAALGGVAWLPVRDRDPAAGHVLVAYAMARTQAPSPEVEARLGRALEADPTCGPALQLLASLRLANGRPQEAYDLFVRAAQDRRTRFTAQVEALPALLDIGRLDEARNVARGLLAQNDHDAALLANAALVAAAAGGLGDPATLLRRAQEIDPRHPTVRRAAARLR